MDVKRAAFALAILAVTSSSCSSSVEATASSGPGANVAGLSIVLDPSTVNVAPGGSAQSIGTVRGALSAISSTVTGAPNDVSVRVTSATTTDSVTTKKYIFFADAAAVPGTYPLSVRVTATGQADVQAQLTLRITGP